MEFSLVLALVGRFDWRNVKVGDAEWRVIVHLRFDDCSPLRLRNLGGKFDKRSFLGSEWLGRGKDVTLG
jgi:hypothetical protein